MKPSSLFLPTAGAALLAAALFAASSFAQAPQTSQSPSSSQAAPAPITITNLQVLPKSMTPDQVHETMGQWGAALGVHCAACHTAPKKADASGHLHPDFADDSKPELKATRSMYRMTEEMNRKYLATSKTPVTCGTCHRGHLIPEAYVSTGVGGPAPAEATPHN